MNLSSIVEACKVFSCRMEGIGEVYSNSVEGYVRNYSEGSKGVVTN